MEHIDRLSAQLGHAASPATVPPPAVSVLMPVRNGERYLDAALESVVAQSFAEFEIVVVDNGSTDSTWNLLAGWTRREPRLRAVRLGRAQLSASLNHAASIARAPLLARLDADDVAYPGRLAAQVAALEAQPAVGLLGTAVELIDGGGRRLGALRPPVSHRDICARQRTSCSLVPSSTIMRAEIFRRVGGYRTGLNVSEDFDLWTRMTEHCEAANLPDLLVAYRIHGGSVTARQPVRMALASLCVTAGVEARRTGVAEPFLRGTPSLRRALPLLGMSRKAARRLVRLRSTSNLLTRRLLGLPLPEFVRTLSPRLVRRLGLRVLYLKWLRRALGPGRCPEKPG